MPQLPTLFIGIGGTGQAILLSMREKLFNDFGKDYRNKPIITEYFYYDLDNACRMCRADRFQDPIFQNHIDFKDNEQFLNPHAPGLIENTIRNLNVPSNAHIKKWCSPNLSYHPGPGAGGSRQVSKLGFYVSYDTIRTKLKDKITSLQQKMTQAGQNKIRVVMVFSVAGGTGCGAFVDFAFLCRDLLKNAFGAANRPEMVAHIILPDAFGNDRNLHANGYAALMELEHYMAIANEYEAEWQLNQNIVVPGPIFDECYLLSNSRYDNSVYNFGGLFDMAADYLKCDLTNESFSAYHASVKVNYNSNLTRNYYNDINVIANAPIYLDNEIYSAKYRSYSLARITNCSEKIKRAVSARLGKAMVDMFRQHPQYKANMAAMVQDAQNFVKTSIISDKNYDVLIQRPGNPVNYLNEARNKINDYFSDSSHDNIIDKNVYVSIINQLIGNLNQDYVNINVKNVINGNLQVLFQDPTLKDNLKQHVVNMMKINSMGDYGIAKASQFIDTLAKEIETIRAKLTPPAPITADNFVIGLTEAANLTNLRNELSICGACRDYLDNLMSRLRSLKGKLAENEACSNGAGVITEILSSLANSAPSKLKEFIDKDSLTNSLDSLKALMEFITESRHQTENWEFSAHAFLIKEPILERIKIIVGQAEDGIDGALKIASLENVNNKISEIKTGINKVLDTIKEKVYNYFKEVFYFNVIRQYLSDYYSRALNFLRPGNQDYFKNFIDNINSSLGMIEKNMSDVDRYVSRVSGEDNLMVVIDGKLIGNQNDYDSCVKVYEDQIPKEMDQIIDYINRWITRFYDPNSGSPDQFIKDLDTNDANIYDKLTDDLNKVTYSVIDDILRSKFDIWTNQNSNLLNDQNAASPIRNIINKGYSISVQKTGQDLGVTGTLIDDKYNNNHFAHIQCFDTKNNANFSRFWNTTANPVPGAATTNAIGYTSDASKESVIFYSEMHGFPLYWINSVCTTLNNDYQAIRSAPSYDLGNRPLHITWHDKFQSLKPVFNPAEANALIDKKRTKLLASLLKVLSYDPMTKSYYLTYTSAVGANSQSRYISNLEQLDSTITCNGLPVNLKIYLDGLVNAKLSSFNINNNIKFYQALLYYKKHILEDVKKNTHPLMLKVNGSPAGSIQFVSHSSAMPATAPASTPNAPAPAPSHQFSLLEIYIVEGLISHYHNTMNLVSAGSQGAAILAQGPPMTGNLNVDKQAFGDLITYVDGNVEIQVNL